MKDNACGLTLSARTGETSSIPPASDWGWYLYGIVRRDDHLDDALTGIQGIDTRQPLRAILQGEIAAIVSRVPLAAFEAEQLRSRLKDVERLEEMIRNHNRVVEHVHRAANILPAKLGCVYVSGESLEAALAQSGDALVASLDRVCDCDEWGVRIYAARSLVQRRVAEEGWALRQLQQEVAIAGPGRAYFLKRKLADLLAATTDQALSDLAQMGYDHLIGRAVAGHVSPRADAPPSAGAETEILRATFLVSRRSATGFVAAVHRFCEDREELRCEYNGPWAPYSFADIGEAKPL